MNHLSRLQSVAIACLLLVNIACRHHNNTGNANPQSTNNDAAITADTPPPVANSDRQWLIEDFSVAKPSYEAAVTTLKTGNWYIADALISNDKSHMKGDGKAARIRNNGKLSMQFDISQTDTVWIRYAVYGNDGPSTFALWLSKDGGKRYEQVGSAVTARSTITQQALFVMNAAGRLRFDIRKTGGGSNRLLIQEMRIGQGKTAAVPPATSPQPGEQHVQMLLGNPTGAVHSINSPDNYLVDHTYYVESYNRRTALPNWVSWHIDASDLGRADRIDDFRPDNSLPGGWFAADASNYKNTGFDKGHNCPSGDRTASRDANSSTFLMNNIIPQAPNNNQRTWEHLESYCREQVKNGNEVYVIMGNYGTGGTGSKGYASSIAGGKINVPAHIWKVAVILSNGDNDLARINKNTKVIAIDTPNDNSLSPDWMKYLTTVDKIETACKCNLLSALPEDLQQVLESKTFGGGN